MFIADFLIIVKQTNKHTPNIHPKNEQKNCRILVKHYFAIKRVEPLMQLNKLDEFHKYSAVQNKRTS